MLRIALSTGIYAYIILVLGLFGMLNFWSILFATLLYFLYIYISEIRAKSLRTVFMQLLKLAQEYRLMAFLICIALLVNLLGAFGPELAFDALWYHLTIPKMYIFAQEVYFIKGGLLYYSLLPKLTEMLYVPALMFGSEIIAKLIQFVFSLLTSIAVFRISRIYVTRTWSIFAVGIFYSSLVVAWLSTTAYVDMTRAFYESLAVYYLLLFQKKDIKKYLLICAVVLGFAISAKLVSLVSVGVFLLLILMYSGDTIYNKLRQMFAFLLVAILIPLPWFIVSFLESGNPVYPLFTQFSPHVINYDFLLPHIIVINLVKTFLFSPDPISPIFLIVFPLLLLNLKALSKYRLILGYSVFSLCIWYVITFSNLWHGTSTSGGSRFLTAYIPVYSVLATLVLVSIKNRAVVRLVRLCLVLILSSTILYRLVAEIKYIPYIVGLQTKQDFLMSNLNFHFGDFYDENNDIQKIVGDRRVLVENIHNLYYIDFDFTMREFQDGKTYEYLLIQDFDNINTPKHKLIYENKITGAHLYKL